MGTLKNVKLPVGYDDFKELIQDGCFYIDKTLFLSALQTKGVNLFLRPRRFGKSLMLSTLKYYYEDNIIADKNDEIERLFKENNLDIMKNPTLNTEMHRFPVIYLSLKSAKQNCFEKTLQKIYLIMLNEVKRHKEITKHHCRVFGIDLNEKDTSITPRSETEFEQYIDKIKSCLFGLSKALNDIHNEKGIIILIDDYDVLLENALLKGFNENMIAFMKTFFELGIKNNPYLKFAVITGCQPIHTEILFAGFDNFFIDSIFNERFQEYFGFNERQVKNAISEFDESYNNYIEPWYGGYNFGRNFKMFNSWSIVYVLHHIKNKEPYYQKSFLANIYDHDILCDMINKAEYSIIMDIETLMIEKHIEKRINKDIKLADILVSNDAFFSCLYYKGYLTKESAICGDMQTPVKLIIPNEEVKAMYKQIIMKQFEKRIALKDFRHFYKALEEGDIITLQNTINRELEESIIYDNSESYYQTFLLELLKRNGKYVIRIENCKDDRYYISMIPQNWKDNVIIIEIKHVTEPFKGKLKKVFDYIVDDDGHMVEDFENMVDAAKKLKSSALPYKNNGYKIKAFEALFFKKSVKLKLKRLYKYISKFPK